MSETDKRISAVEYDVRKLEKRMSEVEKCEAVNSNRISNHSATISDLKEDLREVKNNTEGMQQTKKIVDWAAKALIVGVIAIVLAAIFGGA